MKQVRPALDVSQLCFTFIPPKGWDTSPLAMSFRLRGSLGLSLKTVCCFFDAKKALCEDCVKRDVCHYGQSFETPQAPNIEGIGKVGSMPHAWSLAVDMKGLLAYATITLVGKEQVYIASWKAAVLGLGIEVNWVEAELLAQDFSLNWQSLTPIRLRKNNKVPKTEQDISQALLASVVQTCKALAAVHGQSIPEARLMPPSCENLQWFEEDRYSFRHQEKQKLGGWMMKIKWHNVDEAWLPWLQLSASLGIGRQTSFGLGRVALKEK